MKNEFTPAPGWLAEDVARAKQATASKRDTYPQWGWWGAMIAATDELATLRAEVARLRGALEDIAYARLPGIPDRCTVTVEQVGQFAMQRARTALAKEVGDAT
jgi:hypothetical protein